MLFRCSATFIATLSPFNASSPPSIAFPSAFNASSSNSGASQSPFDTSPYSHLTPLCHPSQLPRRLSTPSIAFSRLPIALLHIYRKYNMSHSIFNRKIPIWSSVPQNNILLPTGTHMFYRTSFSSLYVLSKLYIK